MALSEQINFFNELHSLNKPLILTSSFFNLKLSIFNSSNTDQTLNMFLISFT